MQEADRAKAELALIHIPQEYEWVQESSEIFPEEWDFRKLPLKIVRLSEHEVIVERTSYTDII
jgi:hypothetical protein